jgi:hypothetical protein
MFMDAIGVELDAATAGVLHLARAAATSPATIDAATTAACKHAQLTQRRPSRSSPGWTWLQLLQRLSCYVHVRD